ncbi:AMP-dependent synthetase/ligase [Bacteroidota bacterium]
MKITRTFDLLEKYKAEFNKEDAFAVKQDGSWIKYSTDEYINYSYWFCYGIQKLGLKKGDKIVTITNNRPEWNFVDMGMAMAGIVHVPVFSTLNHKEYHYILQHSDTKLVLVSDKKLYDLVNPLCNSIKSIQNIYSFNEIDGAKNWMEIIESGRSSEKDYKEETEIIKENISPDDLATIIYTSGTTGQPKGVMLSHKNLVSNFISAAGVFQLKTTDRYLSILPLCHVGGRLGNYQTQYSGSSIYYAENMGTIAINMKEIQPQGFDAVPRILEKIYDTVIAKGKKLNGFKKFMFFWAVKVGSKYKTPDESSWLYRKKLAIADKLIFTKWREALGGNIKLVGCGAACLLPHLERIFWACNIKIINMYGLSETSPIITINRTKKPDLKLGSVGALIKDVKVKIADDGEIMCKGPNVMSGYYKDPELTKSVFDKDGWFHTGDIGFLEDNKFLNVTDRKKEIFKLSTGKFIAPQLIENTFKQSIFIDQIMIIGEHQKFASALISPNFSYFKDWCKNENLQYSSNEELINLPQVINLFNDVIKKTNKTLNNHEIIKRFKLVASEWSPGGGELSPTLKLKRRNIENKYKILLDQIYPPKTDY